jgi:hypothetical protein
MEDFYKANHDWLPQLKYAEDVRHLHTNPSGIKKWLEQCLQGGLGNRLEQILKAYQVRRIVKGLSGADGKMENRIIAFENPKQVNGQTYLLPPLIKYSDTELEFHPDSASIKEA